MVEIKGSIVNGSINSIKIRDGEQVYNSIISSLDEKSRKLFKNQILDFEWYPLESFLKFLEEDIKLTANGDENVLVARSEAVNEKYLKNIYGKFAQYESPEFFIKHISILHQGFFRGVTVEIQFNENNNAIIRYTGFKKQHRLIAPAIVGFYKKVLEISGINNIHAEYTTSIEEDKGYCELELTWTEK
jgi:hypothetical protein